MRLAGWLLGFALPLCRTPGAASIPYPDTGSLRGLLRPTSPNHALAAPAHFIPAPDLLTSDYHLAPADLLDALDAAVSSLPGVFALANAAGPAAGSATPDHDPVGPPAIVHRRDYVVRSPLFNFPDLVSVEALSAPSAAGQPNGGLVLWSRSVYGHSDLGANRRRLLAWLRALDARLGSSPASRSAS